VKTELTIGRIRINLASRVRRRWFVATTYSVICVLIAGQWIIAERWPDWASTYAIFLLLFVTTSLNDYLGGGRGLGRGLLKSFDGNERLASYGYDVPGHDIPKYLKDKYLNDERDLRRRNEAHWRAHSCLGLMIALLWAVAGMKLATADVPQSYWLSIYTSSYSYHLLVFSLITAAICVHATLPQAILLWTEPDMEEAR